LRAGWFSAALLGIAATSQAGMDVGRWTLGAGGMWTGTDNDRRVVFQRTDVK
jgi:hypothetical protein